MLKTSFAFIAAISLTAIFGFNGLHALANDATVYWDFSTGFVPPSVIVKQGETVHINNIDAEQSTVTIHATGSTLAPEYFYIELPANASDSHTYDNAGTFGFVSEFGDSVTVTVNAVEGYPAPLWLSNPKIVGGQFQLDVTGLTSGKTNLLQVSTNLVDWTDIQTNVANTTFTTLSDTVSQRPGLYRIVQLP